MKFANIVYKDELVNHKKVEYINYIQENIPFKEIDNELIKKREKHGDKG